MRTVPSLALIAVSALTLTACSTRQAQEATAAQDLLIGMPVQTLLSCAGVPDRREAVDNVEYFTYENIERRSRSGSGVNIGVGGGGGNVGVGVGFGIPLTGGGPDGCVATFTVKDGRVARLVYRDEADSAAACYAIVENCLAIVPGRL